MKPLCFDCLYLFQPGEYMDTLRGDPFSCLAFWPDAIPGDILDGTFDHHKEHPKQVTPFVYTPVVEYVPPRE